MLAKLQGDKLASPSFKELCDPRISALFCVLQLRLRQRRQDAKNHLKDDKQILFLASLLHSNCVAPSAGQSSSAASACRKVNWVLRSDLPHIYLFIYFSLSLSKFNKFIWSTTVPFPHLPCPLPPTFPPHVLTACRGLWVLTWRLHGHVCLHLAPTRATTPWGIM